MMELVTGVDKGDFWPELCGATHQAGHVGSLTPTLLGLSLFLS